MSWACFDRRRVLLSDLGSAMRHRAVAFVTPFAPQSSLRVTDRGDRDVAEAVAHL
jgi:hypothetical protein